MSASMTGQVGGAVGGTDLSSSVDRLQKKVDALETRIGHTMSGARGALVEKDILDLRAELRALALKQSDDLAWLQAQFHETEDRQLRNAALAYVTRYADGNWPISAVLHAAKAFMEWIKDGKG